MTVSPGESARVDIHAADGCAVFYVKIMSGIISKGEAVYAALLAADLVALRRLLSPDFCGHLTEGLPYGFGGVYDGLDAMIKGAWQAIGEYFELRPEVDELFDCSDVLIARGFYVGRARSTHKAFRAAFAHFWDFNGERFTAVRQVTDSGAWEKALRADVF